MNPTWQCCQSSCQAQGAGVWSLHPCNGLYIVHAWSSLAVTYEGQIERRHRDPAPPPQAFASGACVLLQPHAVAGDPASLEGWVWQHTWQQAASFSSSCGDGFSSPVPSSSNSRRDAAFRLPCSQARYSLCWSELVQPAHLLRVGVPKSMLLATARLSVLCFV